LKRYAERSAAIEIRACGSASINLSRPTRNTRIFSRKKFALKEEGKVHAATLGRGAKGNRSGALEKRSRKLARRGAQGVSHETCSEPERETEKVSTSCTSVPGSEAAGRRGITGKLSDRLHESCLKKTRTPDAEKLQGRGYVALEHLKARSQTESAW